MQNRNPKMNKKEEEIEKKKKKNRLCTHTLNLPFEREAARDAHHHLLDLVVAANGQKKDVLSSLSLPNYWMS